MILPTLKEIEFETYKLEDFQKEQKIEEKREKRKTFLVRLFPHLKKKQ